MLIPAAITETGFNLLPKSQNFTSRIDCATGNTRKGVRLIAALFEKSLANICSIRPATVLDSVGNDSNLLIVFYVQIVPDDFVMQLH
ncbi:hypothetical protein VST00_25740, partial [Klebsiella pneumoniae]